MTAIEETERELNAMLDEGVRIRVVAPAEGAYELHVSAADEACAECLVNDATLSAIARDALQRHGATAEDVSVHHEDIGAPPRG